MADGLSFHVDGLEGLQAKLRELAADMQKKAAHSAVLAAATVVKKAAIAKAPQSEKPHTVGGVVVQPGNLKRNVILKRLPASRTHLTSEYIVTVRQKGAGKNAFYGRYIEFGTVKMAAHPFLRPALLDNKNAATAAMAEKLAKSIKKFSS